MKYFRCTDKLKGPLVILIPSYATKQVAVSLASTKPPADYLDRLASAIRGKKRPFGKVNLRELGNRVRALLSATGIFRGTDERSTAFRAAIANLPTHKQLLRRYQALGAARDPTRSRLLSGIVFIEMRARAQIDWAARIQSGEISASDPFRRKPPHTLSDADLADIRRFARDVARVHRGGARSDIVRDTLLRELADIYAGVTGFSYSSLDVGHSVDSRFIGFAHLALAPFFPATMVTTAALSKRFDRLRKREQV